ncbi:NAD(P)H-dependent oxidoreductase [Undibacterium sp.]|uniref:NAD(P)H-dependent oxidoreductase n=1 Tax=Undibacterium sp. TaxID=1914977 RepID=UPI002CB84DEE|nr:NAD(P)H-dependent oxidoreductase [Undibacterium sp.]HTD06620.1 NAD(P)H-dependent oxidoreductase [Undibacterium sp.]
MKNVLILNSHQLYQGISTGGLNKTTARIIKEEMEKRGYEVRQTAIEEGYDVDAEVQKHVWADIIILQSPVYWFGMPWIYKRYVDEVFTAGLIQQSLLIDDGRTRQDPNKQYGTGGKMQGKKYMLSLTWNAPKEAFDDTKQFLFQGKSVDEIFVGNTANYKFCGAEVLPSFSCHDVMKQANVDRDIARLRQHLEAVVGPYPMIASRLNSDAMAA